MSYFTEDEIKKIRERICSMPLETVEDLNEYQLLRAIYYGEMYSFGPKKFSEALKEIKKNAGMD